ncbi:AAA domain-containing protein [Arcticibacter tournemirensis]|uniref:AAA family ATPase n=1 Tax=Arcticibacter tournemirensis TaxID=699437 RepID=A0A5M9HH69_9SPHI|nr:AAA family ATPase [Arcticibacter tournemirensis]KAA8485879.1 AAA family ATPase [Arcticibacter tournemirensis]TQM46868.1 AAA domain-containing protein [Arcticibacter tournemirensis]
MKKIKEIKIQNFKAFQREQVFSVNGKHVLVYGNNGSGKSSLFWALYTLLQSSIKEDNGVQKYFRKYVASDKATHQTLKNVFMEDNEESFIKLTSIDTETKHEETFTISHDLINTNDDANTLIQELNIASDFINYKLLHNFYRASHKQEVNLWPVFERDIFPFLTEGTQNWLDVIIKAPTLDVPRTPKGAVASRNRKQLYIDQIDALNEKIQNLLNEISGHANKFLKDHFFEGKDVIKVSLSFDKKFRFDLIRNRIWEDNKQGHRFDDLHIKLGVEIYDDTIPEKWRAIERVQSFLNEAQLTRIAIGVRIGALRTRPLASARFKILVLDDMLISLDLSNRMDVVRIILNKEEKEDLKFFDGFQKFILTHDKGFFNLIRRNTDEEEWVYFNFSKDEKDSSAPKIKEDKTPLQKAIKNFEEDEFDACGNELRKEAEAILTEYLDPDMKKLNGDFETLSSKLEKAFNQLTGQRHQKFTQRFLLDLDLAKLKKIKSDYSTDGTLTPEEKANLDSIKIRLFDFLIEFNEKKNRKELLITETKDILDRIMNAASHHSENPLHREELKSAITKMVELKEHLKHD